jgi:hypothetical protein
MRLVCQPNHFPHTHAMLALALALAGGACQGAIGGGAAAGTAGGAPTGGTGNGGSSGGAGNAGSTSPTCRSA